MGRYSDLRWKIADLEKQLEEEKIAPKRRGNKWSIIFALYMPMKKLLKN